MFTAYMASESNKGGNKMKKLLFGTIVLALVSVFPITTMAGVDVSVGISIPLPPPVTFEAPPPVVALPDTEGVYVAPGVSVDIFFWNGFWWRPWEGRWYRSPYYDRGWAYFNHVPRFYSNVDPYWRGNYQNHNWHGHIGIINRFLMHNFNRTGRAGRVIDPGAIKEPGVFRVIHQNRNNKDKRHTNKNLEFKNISKFKDNR